MLGATVPVEVCISPEWVDQRSLLKNCFWQSPNPPEIHRGAKGAESLLGNNDCQYLLVNSKLENSLWVCRSLFIILTECACVCAYVSVFACVCESARYMQKEWKTERNHLRVDKKVTGEKCYALLHISDMPQIQKGHCQELFPLLQKHSKCVKWPRGRGW